MLTAWFASEANQTSAGVHQQCITATSEVSESAMLHVTYITAVTQAYGTLHALLVGQCTPGCNTLFNASA